MNHRWPPVSLGQLIRLERRPVQVLPQQQYQEIGIYCFGRGIFHKVPRSGLEIGDKDLFLMKQGDFILQITFAWEGAIAIVSSAEDDMYGSTRYPTFRVDESRVVPQFLLHYFKTEEGLQQLIKICPGSAGRNRVLSIKRIPEVSVPVPPLPEQHRIVARIEELSAKIREAHRLHQENISKTDRLLVAMAHRQDLDEVSKRQEGWKAVALGEVIRQVQDSHAVRPITVYPNLGIYSFGRGLFRKPPIEGSSTSAVTLHRVRSGQFIYSRLFAFEGAYGIVSDELDGCFVSNEYPTFECSDQIRAEFLYAYFKSPAVWTEVAAGSQGLGHRRQRVQPVRILGYQLMLPPIHWQDRIRFVMAKVNTLKRLQEETAKELNALIPSILSRAFAGDI